MNYEDLKEIIDKNLYYEDKSELILQVLKDEVAFYTRPRRFGKTLNMSMLRYFFDLKEKDNAYLFDELKIQLRYALEKYRKDIENSSVLEEIDKELFVSIVTEKQGNRISSSIREVSQILYKHYGKKVIILIDEYDVPLQAAYKHGYYDEMVSFMKTLFLSALKTNNTLEKGIMTGCLKIAKESIFTGLNNFRVHSIFDEAGSEYFGFTVEETKQLLDDYGMLDSYDSIKEWYDGYL